MAKLHELEDIYRDVSLPGPFLDFEDLLVHDNSQRILGPYLPYVGEQYEKHKILFYLTAQNLAKEPDLVRQYSEHPSESLKRLDYKWSRRPDEVPSRVLNSKIHSHLDLGPVSGGVIPALCAIYLKANHDLWIENSDEAMSYLSVTNFYKLSLVHNKGDLNPSKLGARNAAYSKLMFDTFVRKELEILKPKVVFCFKGEGTRILKEAQITGDISPFNLIEINDTAWILRGGGLCLKECGSWACKTPEIDVLLSAFENWLGWSYQGKKEAVKTYLRHYYKQFISHSTRNIEPGPEGTG